MPERLIQVVKNGDVLFETHLSPREEVSLEHQDGKQPLDDEGEQQFEDDEPILQPQPEVFTVSLESPTSEGLPEPAPGSRSVAVITEDGSVLPLDDDPIPAAAKKVIAAADKAAKKLKR